MKRIKFFAKSLLLRVLNYRRFRRGFLSHLPNSYRLAALFLFFPFPTKEERKIAKKIESFRSLIPTLANSTNIPSFSSPHSGSFMKYDNGHAKTGDYKLSSVSAHI